MIKIAHFALFFVLRGTYVPTRHFKMTQTPKKTATRLKNENLKKEKKDNHKKAEKPRLKKENLKKEKEAKHAAKKRRKPQRGLKKFFNA
jgi:hypothetical protein